jgi:hypothetical protein
VIMMAAIPVCMFLYVTVQDSVNLQVGRNPCCQTWVQKLQNSVLRLLEWAGGLCDKCIAVVGAGVFFNLASAYRIGILTSEQLSKTCKQCAEVWRNFFHPSPIKCSGLLCCRTLEGQALRCQNVPPPPQPLHKR